MKFIEIYCSELKYQGRVTSFINPQITGFNWEPTRLGRPTYTSMQVYGTLTTLYTVFELKLAYFVADIMYRSLHLIAAIHQFSSQTHSSFHIVFRYVKVKKKNKPNKQINKNEEIQPALVATWSSIIHKLQSTNIIGLLSFAEIHQAVLY